MLDPVAGTPTRLPSVVNAAVDDLYFSPDGLWLAASHVDGSVQVWDVDSAAPVVMPLHLSASQDTVVGTMNLDPQRRQIYVSEPERSQLWYLPGPEQPPRCCLNDQPIRGRSTTRPMTR